MKKLSIILAMIAILMAGTLEAKEWKKIRIGVEGAYPPFSSITPEGKLVGFDIDIARALCEEMKAECTLVQSDWDGIIPSLLARKYDAIIAAMSITEDRKKKVAFTGRYLNTPVKFAAHKNFLIRVLKGEQWKKKIGVQRATVFDTYITDNFGDKVEIVRYGNQEEAYLDLKAERLDLILNDGLGIEEAFLTKPGNEDFELIGPDLYGGKWFGEGAGIAIRKQDKDLVEKFNAAIDAIRANGTYKKIQDKYFDFDVYGE
jgi:arginine/ornithine transport system substrate-binding protein